MKIISLWQPWATLIAYGYKGIETRSWSTFYRGPIAIHAAKKWDRQLYALCLTEPFITCLKEIGHGDPASLPLGCVVAKCNLRDVVPTNDDQAARRAISTYGSDYEQYFGDYSPNRFLWTLLNGERFAEPIPLKGQMGIWEWTQPFGVQTILSPIRKKSQLELEEEVWEAWENGKGQEK